MDVAKKQFGRLTVLSEAPRKGYVICKCDCGRVCQVSMYNLINHKTRSCGCLRRETSSANGRNSIRENSEKRLERIAKYGTNVGLIANPNPRRDNKSGHKGVWYNQAHGTYEAYISLKHKKYHLGVFHNFNEAVAARLEAEERLFSPILADIQAE